MATPSSSSYFTRITPTTIRDNSTTTLTILKQKLRIAVSDTSKDVELEQILSAVKTVGDEKCLSKFPAFNGVVPPDVEVWIQRQCATLYEWSTNGVYSFSEPGFGAAQLKELVDKTLLQTKRVFPGF